jgi:CheY-like chemotaxis protein
MSRVALVVDDSMLIRHSVCRFLEERGYIVESASNGLDAMEILNTVIPDIIITDLQMPKMDGPELISKIKASKGHEAVPIVVLAGRTASNESPEGRADYIIFKDIEIEAQLQKALTRLLGEHARA